MHQVFQLWERATLAKALHVCKITYEPCAHFFLIVVRLYAIQLLIKLLIHIGNKMK